MKHRLIPFEMPAQTGGNEQTIDVTSSDLDAKFIFAKVPARDSLGRFAYVDSIDFLHRTQIDVGASTPPLVHQELGRTVSTFEIDADDGGIGALYKPNDITGPWLQEICSIISNGYRRPYYAMADMAGASTNNVRVLRHRIPIAHRCFKKGHQTALPAALLHNARLELTLAASTALAAIIGSSATEATTSVRCIANVFYSTDPYLPQPWVWREYDTPASQTDHIIRALGTGAGIANASRDPQKVAFLAWLAGSATEDATAGATKNPFGFGGSTTVEQVQQIQSVDLGIPNLSMGSPWYGPSAFLHAFVGDIGNRVTQEETALGNGWPYYPGADLISVPLDIDAGFIPYFWPDVDGQEVSVLPAIGRDITITHQYGTIPARTNKFVSLEQCVYDPAMEDFFRARMGLRKGFVAVPKTLRDGQGPEPSNPDALAIHAQKLLGVPQKFRQVEAG